MKKVHKIAAVCLTTFVVEQCRSDNINGKRDVMDFEGDNNIVVGIGEECKDNIKNIFLTNERANEGKASSELVNHVDMILHKLCHVHLSGDELTTELNTSGPATTLMYLAKALPSEPRLRECEVATDVGKFGVLNVTDKLCEASLGTLVVRGLLFWYQSSASPLLQ